MYRYDRKEPTLLYVLDWIRILYQFIKVGNPRAMPGSSVLCCMMEYHLAPKLNE